MQSLELGFDLRALSGTCVDGWEGGCPQLGFVCGSCMGQGDGGMCGANGAPAHTTMPTLEAWSAARAEAWPSLRSGGALVAVDDHLVLLGRRLGRRCGVAGVFTRRVGGIGHCPSLWGDGRAVFRQLLGRLRRFIVRGCGASDGTTKGRRRGRAKDQRCPQAGIQGGRAASPRTASGPGPAARDLKVLAGYRQSRRGDSLTEVAGNLRGGQQSSTGRTSSFNRRWCLSRGGSAVAGCSARMVLSTKGSG